MKRPLVYVIVGLSFVEPFPSGCGKYGEKKIKGKQDGLFVFSEITAVPLMDAPDGREITDRRKVLLQETQQMDSWDEQDCIVR